MSFWTFVIKFILDGIFHPAKLNEGAEIDHYRPPREYDPDREYHPVQ